MAFEPFELNALPRHLFALFAHLLTLARTQGVEKVLEVAITAILPMKLATQPLQPTRLFRQQGVGHRIGEVDVRARQLFDVDVTGQARQQLNPGLRGRRQ